MNKNANTRDQKGIIQRKSRIYWVKGKKDDKDLLIFDRGYNGGDVHIYELKDSFPQTKIEEYMKNYYQIDDLPTNIMSELVMNWVEKKFGSTMYWEFK